MTPTSESEALTVPTAGLISTAHLYLSNHPIAAPRVGMASQAVFTPDDIIYGAIIADKPLSNFRGNYFDRTGNFIALQLGFGGGALSVPLQVPVSAAQLRGNALSFVLAPARFDQHNSSDKNVVSLFTEYPDSYKNGPLTFYVAMLQADGLATDGEMAVEFTMDLSHGSGRYATAFQHFQEESSRSVDTASSLMAKEWADYPASPAAVAVTFRNNGGSRSYGLIQLPELQHHGNQRLDLAPGTSVTYRLHPGVKIFVSHDSHCTPERLLQVVAGHSPTTLDLRF